MSTSHVQGPLPEFGPPRRGLGQIHRMTRKSNDWKISAAAFLTWLDKSYLWTPVEAQQAWHKTQAQSFRSTQGLRGDRRKENKIESQKSSVKTGGQCMMQISLYAGGERRRKTTVFHLPYRLFDQDAVTHMERLRDATRDAMRDANDGPFSRCLFCPSWSWGFGVGIEMNEMLMKYAQVQVAAYLGRDYWVIRGGGDGYA